jgi:hypothetical protein
MMHSVIVGHPLRCKFSAVCNLLGVRSHKKNFILGDSGRVHIFCRIGCGIPGLLRNVYVDLTVN